MESKNKLKIMLSFLRELNDDNIAKAEDYEITKEEFNNIVEVCQDEGYIKGARFIRGKQNRIIIALLENAKLTVKGMEYLQDNSTFNEGL
ncbi:MAG: YjcQ family protein [Clostridiales bacterium]|nr:YjcQ family protein [Clostridiales bacterium]